MRTGLLACLVLLLLGASSGPGRAEAKLAFVVGIDAYANLPVDAQLKRASGDADAVGETLQRMGFSVTRANRDGTLDHILADFERFARAVQPGDTVLFYYAGHGISLADGNYLLPGDVPLLGPTDERLAKRWSIAERDVRQDLRAAGAKVVVVVLDACRNNPFPAKGTRAVGATTRGLARIDTSEGVFALYSAREGQTALDRLSDSDADAHSVFARVFLKDLNTPGLSLSELGDRVRDEVAALTRGAGAEQVPAVANDLVGARSVYLAGSAVPTAGEAATQIASTTSQATTAATEAASPASTPAPAASAASATTQPAMVPPKSTSENAARSRPAAASPSAPATPRPVIPSLDPATTGVPSTVASPPAAAVPDPSTPVVAALPSPAEDRDEPALPPPPVGDRPAAPSGSVWYHNGSEVRLLSDGPRRTFVYEQPRGRLVALGVRRGTVLFTGQRVGDTYEGTAYQFKEGCEPGAYPVSGTVSGNDREIVLGGQAPIRDRTCHLAERKQVSLRFSLQPAEGAGPGAPAGDAAARFAPVVRTYFEMAGASGRRFDDFMASAYADNVRYYGRRVPRGAILGQKRDFAVRWPARRYAFDPNASTTICDAALGECRFSGLVSWSVGNPETTLKSTGSAQVEMTWRLIDGVFRIVSETSKVVSRN